MTKTLIALAILAAPLSASAQGGVGRVVGHVTEGTCHTPLAYANVLVLGTDRTAMTDTDGAFAIDSIAPGTYKVRVMMMGYAWGNTKAMVQADETTSLSVTLTSQIDGDKRKPRPSATKACAVHGVDMRAVAVRIGSGDMKPPAYAAEIEAYPNAEPFAGDGKRLGVPLLGVTWAYRCAQCAQARNEHANGGSWPLSFDDSPPADWSRYTVANTVTFAAPAGLAATTTGNDCAATGTWVGAGVRVTATYGPAPFVEQFGRGDMSGDVIIGNEYVRVTLWNDGGGAKLASGFWAPPVGHSWLTLVVQVDDAAAIDTATRIAGSVRFTAN